MKKQFEITAREIPMGIKGINGRNVPGYVLENGLVLMECERDKNGNYKAGAGMDGMYLQTGQHFAPVFGADNEITAFVEAE